MYNIYKQVYEIKTEIYNRTWEDACFRWETIMQLVLCFRWKTTKPGECQLHLGNNRTDFMLQEEKNLILIPEGEQ
jgi:hypothetical protein